MTSPLNQGAVFVARQKDIYSTYHVPRRHCPYSAKSLWPPATVHHTSVEWPDSFVRPPHPVPNVSGQSEKLFPEDTTDTIRRYTSN